MRQPPGRADALLALGLASLFALLSWLTRSDVYWDDGSKLVSELVRSEVEERLPLFMHVAYLPLGRVVRALLPGLGAEDALLLVSALSAGVGSGATLLLARGLGCRRSTGLGAALLLSLCPAAWIFGRLVELYELHLATVALAACATVYAPWQRRGPALALSSLAFALVPLTHRSAPLLGPGWVLLVQLAAARRGRPFTARGLLLVVGPAHLAALVGGMFLAAQVRAEMDLGFVQSLRLIGAFFRGFAPAKAWTELVEPLGLLVPLALVGFLARRTTALERAASLTVILPSVVFFLGFGFPSLGGFYLGVAPFLALLAAWGVDRVGPLRHVAALGALVLLQGAWTARPFPDEDRLRSFAEERHERAAWTVRAAGGRPAVLLCVDPTYQTISGAVDGLVEHNLIMSCLNAARSDLSPAQNAERLLAILRAIVHNSQGPIFVGLTAPGLSPDAQAIYEAFLEAVRSEFEVREIEHERWPLLRLELPRSPTPSSHER